MDIGAHGNFYGTTANGGGALGGIYGTVFRLAPSYAFSTIYNFNGPDGRSPMGLIEATDGKFYGTTGSGGDSNMGTVFSITSTGVLTTLHQFGTDGAHPYGGLLQGRDGNFYGTTTTGGASNVGTVFRLDPTGTLTTLHTFSGPDGALPYGQLIEVADAVLYGTTVRGGPANEGVIFRMTLATADLAISSFSAPGATAAGTLITVKDTTTNVGNAAAPASTTGYYLSHQRADSTAIRLGERKITALTTGQSASASTKLTIPSATRAGVYYLIAKADDANGIIESNEANNTRVRTIKIGPDLRVPALSAPTSALAGAIVAIGDTTMNFGQESDHIETVTRFYLSTNRKLDSSDVLLGERLVQVLGCFGCASSNTTNVSVPADTTPGYYYILGVADATNVAQEVYETNNTKSVGMTVGK